MAKFLFDYDKKLISILTPREQVIVTMYFGLGGRSHTLGEIAKKFEVSSRTIAKYRDQALQKLEKNPQTAADETLPD